MKEIWRTNNPVEISYILHELAEIGIEGIEFDQHASIVEGSIGAIQRRIMVHDDDEPRALRLIEGLDVLK